MDTESSVICANVAVIGAGFSGLQAALDVQSQGFTCVLIEAHGRVGGKSMTKQLISIDGAVEMGPTWINDKTQPRMYVLVTKYGLEVVQQYIDRLEVMQDADGTISKFKHGELPITANAKEIEIIMGLRFSMETESAKFDTERPGQWIDATQPPLIPDISFEEWLRQNGVTSGTAAYGMMRFVSAGCFGVEPREIGMHYILDMLKQGRGWESLTTDYSKGAQHLWLKQGTTALAKRMADALTPGSLILGAPVIQVAQKGPSCTLTTMNGQIFQCNKAIITNDSHTFTHIDFIPPLPKAKRELATRTPRGRYAKSVLTYTTPWWREMGLLGSFTSLEKGPVAFSWEVSKLDKGQYSLACFTCGDCYSDHFEKTKLQRQQAILDHLADMIGGAIRPEKKDVVYDCIEFIEQDWYETASIEGAPMAAFGPGDFAKSASALRQPFKNIHFAGTETASDWKGYMEGAVEAGSRAAHEVADVLKPKLRI